MHRDVLHSLHTTLMCKHRCWLFSFHFYSPPLFSFAIEYSDRFWTKSRRCLRSNTWQTPRTKQHRLVHKYTYTTEMPLGPMRPDLRIEMMVNVIIIQVWMILPGAIVVSQGSYQEGAVSLFADHFMCMYGHYKLHPTFNSVRRSTIDNLISYRRILDTRNLWIISQVLR